MYSVDENTLNQFNQQRNPILAEKDYLECAILDKIFSDPYFHDSFVFAGGGTITKIYQIGNRIGQDIDLALTEFDTNPQNSSQLHRFRVRFTKFVFNDLNIKVTAALSEIGDFNIITDAEYRIQNNITTGCVSPTLHVIYDSEIDPEINGDINIEFIPRHYSPAAIQHKPATPFSTGIQMTQDIPAVHYAQTFWDKVFALHTIHEIGVMRPGLATHYTDVAHLSKCVNLNETQDMLLDISEYQRQFTTRKMTPLKSVRDVHLLPSVPDMKRLSIDYGQMQNRFISGNIETWPRILITINKINRNINKLQEKQK